MVFSYTRKLVTGDRNDFDLDPTKTTFLMWSIGPTNGVDYSSGVFQQVEFDCFFSQLVVFFKFSWYSKYMCTACWQRYSACELFWRLCSASKSKRWTITTYACNDNDRWLDIASLYWYLVCQHIHSCVWSSLIQMYISKSVFDFILFIHLIQGFMLLVIWRV
jgi:hypothetical protein